MRERLRGGRDCLPRADLNGFAITIRLGHFENNPEDYRFLASPSMFKNAPVLSDSPSSQSGGHLPERRRGLMFLQFLTLYHRGRGWPPST